MVMVHDGGGGGGAGVQMLLDEIVAIAKDTMGSMHADASNQTTRFRNGNLPAGAFNGLEQGVEFHAQEQAAQAVFVSTIEKVLAELETFGQTLIDNVESARKVDEANATGFGAMTPDQQAAATALSQTNEQYGEDHTYASEEAYQEGLDDESLDVDVDEDAPAQVPLDGGAEDDTTQAADDLDVSVAPGGGGAASQGEGGPVPDTGETPGF